MSAAIALSKPPMTDQQLIEAVYELAYGEDAIANGYTHEQVVEKLTQYTADIPDLLTLHEEAIDFVDTSPEDKAFHERCVKYIAEWESDKYNT